MKFYDELVWRGLIKDISSPELEEKLNKGGLVCYIGADPTADSLHIGQLPSFLMIERMKRAGHKPMVLVGGATGLVGDPRGTGERDKADAKVIESNFVKIQAQMKKLFGEDIVSVNNYDWFKDMNYIEFLREVGKLINVNYMINKDLIKRQLDIGISYAEFSYMLIQGYDFKYLHDKYGVTLQFGGSDQWGNLTTGIELIRKMNNEEVYAFSMPLVVDSTGKKLGKSYGNALWLDKNKTSSYELYQYILNFEDVMMEDYLKRYTFLNKEEVDSIMAYQNEKPEERLAQKRLAEEVITFLHGHDEYEKAKMISESLFSDKVWELSSEDIIDSLTDITKFDITKDISLIDILVNNNICSSKREAREMISGNAISLNNTKINDLEYVVSKKDAIDQKVIIIKKGKKNYYLGIYN
ncbi:MAG: tyrosine--tRNA ligase [Bacilli bacterium]|nr:tyrosine--tRNA ligase [Bacilli bacterium]